MENNNLFFFKIYVRDAVKLPLWTNKATKTQFFLNSVSQVNFVSVFENGTLDVQEFPLSLEIRSATYKTKEKCPFVAFHNNIDRVFYILDKKKKLLIWAQIVYPENKGLYIIMELYGPKLLEYKFHNKYEIASGFCTKTMVSCYFKMSFDFNKCKSIMLIFFKTDFPSRFSLEPVEKHTFFFS